MNENFIGAKITDEGAFFRVWAPRAEEIQLILIDSTKSAPMQREEEGYFTLLDPSIAAGAKYMFSLDGGPYRPDPASSFQPDGVHGASQVVDHTFGWTDGAWIPPTLSDSVLYELHVGTFTPEGTFARIIPQLLYLKELGVTTVQLMPVAQFPGSRNWGYDGVQLYAPHNTYGGPHELKRLINACHEMELAIYLDVVYNHLGPEGNYLWDFGPYFTDQYRSPWGESMNLDGAYSDHVRHFLIQNAIYWLDHFRFDGLRLDATHALFDFSARPFLAELSTSVHAWATRMEREITLIAENDQNDRRLTLPTNKQGLGLDGQWMDDFHHTLHTALTHEKSGYYADYQDPQLLPKVLQDGFAYTGQYSLARKRRHGTHVHDLSTDRFVVCTQNHDQVGNRLHGERLSNLTSFEGLKVAACLLACSPFTPMLFMGEEYGETAPFLYFTSHADLSLIEAIREGRKAEFSDFDWNENPPDPQSESTFLQCKLDHTLRSRSPHSHIYRLYKTPASFTKKHPCTKEPRSFQLHSSPGPKPEADMHGTPYSSGSNSYYY